MQRLVIGILTKHKALTPRNVRLARAFSLIEVMVVIVIMAIVTTIAVVTFGGFNQGRRLANAAQNVLALTQTVQTQAILQPAFLGLRFYRHGYRIYRYDMDLVENTGEWHPITRAPWLDAVSIPGNVSLQLLSLNHKKDVDVKNQKHPQIVFSPGSQNTAFRLKISLAGYPSWYVLTVKNNSNATLRRVHEKA